MTFPPSFQAIEEDELDIQWPSSFKAISETENFIDEARPSRRSEIKRNVARSGSRALESVLGLPGDILRTADVLSQGTANVASGIREKIGLSPLDKKQYKKPVPGSTELKEISQKLFGEIVTPQNQAESFVDDIVSDAAVLALPVKGKIPFMRAIGTAVAGNVAQEGAKQLGLGEKGQIAAKLGAFFLSGLAGKGSVKKYWNQQYTLAEEALPHGAKVETFALERKLDKLQNELGKGIDTPSKKFVEGPLKDIRKKVKKGTVKIDELIQMKKDINEHRGKLYKDLTGKQSVNYAQGKINDLSAILDEEIAKYGKKNPEFYKHYKNANEAYAGFNQSRRVGRWINRQLGRIGKPALFILEGMFPKLIPASITSFVGLKAGEVATRVMRNPTLRRFYGNMVKDAVKENSSGFVKNLNKLQEEIKKSDPDLFEDLTSQSESNQ